MAVANLAVATNETWKDKNGERQERTEWHRIVLFGKPAEIAGEYLRKGALAYFEGRLQTRKWQGQDGQDRYTTEIVAERLRMLGGRGERDGAASGPSANGSQAAPPPPFDDDIPF